eukprot:GHRR01033489.1.p1 GENE.GHRR01033489.1~~GHRR01033489.1.p1  ORF type:complete len:118 (-),score=15.14 GHRR01033489.1:1244-1597(-)
MPTSFAPSPIASVVSPQVLTSAVTCAFCNGDTRQHSTAAHFTPTCRKGRRGEGGCLSMRWCKLCLYDCQMMQSSPPFLLHEQGVPFAGMAAVAGFLMLLVLSGESIHNTMGTLCLQQ